MGCNICKNEDDIIDVDYKYKLINSKKDHLHYFIINSSTIFKNEMKNFTDEKKQNVLLFLDTQINRKIEFIFDPQTCCTINIKNI